ncbi:hypothetical protein GPALN_010859 [Globodera pallida]|nr:hypothetical protein GPALN_010859 [Globodera pallida]
MSKNRNSDHPRFLIPPISFRRNNFFFRKKKKKGKMRKQTAAISIKFFASNQKLFLLANLRAHSHKKTPTKAPNKKLFSLKKMQNLSPKNVLLESLGHINYVPSQI